MHLIQFERPTGEGNGRVRKVAALAGFLGAIPFGFGLLVTFLVLSMEVERNRRPNLRFASHVLLEALGLLLAAAVSLTPFAMAMTRVDRRGWLSVLFVVIPGLVLGAVALLLWFVAGPILILAGVLGLVLGLTFGLSTLRPRESRDDAAGRALAVLGMTPALLALILWVAERCRLAFPWATSLFLVQWLAEWGVTTLLAATCLAALALLARREWRRGRVKFKPGVRSWE